MSKPKFTPGPWEITGADQRFIAQQTSDESDIGSIFAEVWFNVGHRHNQKANAALIAAAPEMYEVLQKLVEWNRKYPSNQDYHSIGEIVKIGDLCNAICKHAEWVLKKAEGKQKNTKDDPC